VFAEFFTQYYPHEHTDQPPYVWDASKRPKHLSWYGPSKRQHTATERDIGVMNAVDYHYVQYLSERLSDLEHEWRTIKPGDIDGRRRWLVRMGKLLHGIEDWYFHSNVVELVRLRAHRPQRSAGEDSNAFLKRFVQEVSGKDPEFLKADPTERLRLQRRLYRRLRFPAYEPGDRENSGGKFSKKTSTPSLNMAYPAFPSQQDTAHTLLHALENLERKAKHPSSSSGPPTLSSFISSLDWVPCVFGKLTAAKDGEGRKLLQEKANARGMDEKMVLPGLASKGPERDRATAVVIDVLREWIPLVVTLLNESERQRLLADVDPLKWPIGTPTPAEVRGGPRGKGETEKQLARHTLALKRKKNEDGLEENNYERAARYLVECGFLNASGRKALVMAFEIDQKSEKLLEGAPGCGGFLIKFALDLQRALDEGDAATEELNKKKDSVFNPATDNGAFNEIIGSHSLMSEDTLTSPPFFDDAKVLASVASSSVFHIMLEQTSAPTSGKRVPWKAILHHFIRFPPVSGGWERHAMAFYRDRRTTEGYPGMPICPNWRGSLSRHLPRRLRLSLGTRAQRTTSSRKCTSGSRDRCRSTATRSTLPSGRYNKTGLRTERV
jgi:hypothetical protein